MPSFSKVTIEPDQTNTNDTKIVETAQGIHTTRTYKVLLLEGISQSAVDYLTSAGFEVSTAKHLSPSELAKKLESVDVVGVRSKTKLTKDVLSKHGKNLMCVGCFCIGTDQTDLDCSSSLGIPVFNSAFANTRSVAELVLSNAIALSRKVGDQNKWMHEGQWRKTSKNCYEVRGKTLGIVGYGNVGSQLSVLAEALGFRVIFHDILPKLPLGNAKQCSSLNDLLKQSDFVSIHVPLTEQTNNFIGEEQMKRMKKGSFLMNAARGKCVNIDDAAKLLRSEHLGGAYFDVYPQEPTNEHLVLCGCPNTILTPHIGGSTEEAQRNIGVDVATKIAKFVHNGNTVGSVNFPAVCVVDAKTDTFKRIINVYRNKGGALAAIYRILSQFNVVMTVNKRINSELSYLIIDIEKVDNFKCQQIENEMSLLEQSVRTRVVSV